MKSLELLLDRLVMVGALGSYPDQDMRALAEAVTEIGNRLLDIEIRVPPAPIVVLAFGEIVPPTPPGYRRWETLGACPGGIQLRAKR